MQGDVTAIVDGSGATVATYVYDAWGNLISDEPAENTIGHLNPIRYRGYVYDAESGFYYLQSRYYDSELGRFLNADAFASTGQGLLGNNMFAYCNNNPVNATDRNGKVPDTSAGWIGEEIGKFIYELITGEDHPSREAERIEAETTQKQNEMIQAGVKALWDAYMWSCNQQQEAQLQQAIATRDFVADRFSTPEKARNTLNGIGITIEAVGIYVGIVCGPIAGGVATGVGLLFNAIAWGIDVSNEE